ncbi:SEC-C motif-containing protein [Motilibacter rhizosphaerae]|uniref:SEC-C motif-containing protein n=1 Tax=Motilibacter rhizosphaerae TaxID=598652 RepID=A0A4Q7NYN9_9ACTN|nr:YchJ family metal-binding protein [Motilibacter rhizosphaerae]RZS91522.1 SEC-C motif-containing protein [Motilibacter rhizosphaerae]
MADDTRAVPCPCGTGLELDACCGRYLAGEPAPTAEALMRSRFTAYARADVAHLLRTWHPTTRPARLVLDPDLAWERLVVLDVVPGGLFDDTGEVEFVATYRQGGRRGRLAERSRFTRVEGAWAYVDGDVR